MDALFQRRRKKGKRGSIRYTLEAVRISHPKFYIWLDIKATKWICFACGTPCCEEEDHIQQHNKSLPSHHFAICLKTMKVKCWTCQIFLAIPEDISHNSDFQGIREAMLLLKGDFSLLEKKTKSLPSSSGAIPGIKGLQNNGNTCFFNSALQNLIHSPFLVHYFLSPKKETESPLVSAFREIFQSNFSSGKSVLNPHNLFQEICKKSSQFRGGAQQDSHELLIEFLDRLDIEEKKRIKSTQQTFVQEAFGGR